MARSMWKGVISFGLVSVPVAMYSATREHEVTFHQFEKGTGDRIRYQRINERTGDEVEYADIVRGADVGGGDYVMLEPDELDEIAPGQSRSLEIHQFVDLDEVDPIYFQKTYYLGPGGDDTSGTTKAYVLLRDALADTNRAGIGTLVMRGKEYLAAVRADDELLVLETMFFADEIRDRKEVVDPMPGRVKAKPQELRMAGQLIESMTAKWVPEEFRDSYTDRVKDLIEAKKDGDEVTAAEPPPDATEVTDLMEALRRSVEATRKNRRANASAGEADAEDADSKDAGSKDATAKDATAKGGGKKAGAKKAGAKKAGAKNAGAAKGGGKRAVAKKAGATKAGATKAGAAKGGGKRAVAKKAGATKAGTKKAGAKKAGATKAAGTNRAGMRVAASRTAKKAA